MYEQPVTLPWGGETADALADFRAAAMVSGSNLTRLAGMADDPHAPFEVIVTWRLDGDRADPIAVELRARGSEQVTADVWRSVRVGECITWTRHLLGWMSSHASAELAGRGRHASAARHEETREALQEPRRPGRPPVYTDEHYGEVADVYVRAVKGASRSPVREVREAFASRYPGVLEPTDTRPKAWVREARRRGYIDNEEG